MPLRRLTGLDTAFLAAERPGNLLHMMGVLVLDPSSMPGGYSFDGFRQFVAGRLPALSPLRRRLVEVPAGLARPYWTEAPEIELDYHLRRAAVPSPGGPRELATMARTMLERPLDRNHPLWEMELVEGLETGRLALLAKLSHAMMDGVAGVRLMSSLFANTPEITPPPSVEPLESGPLPGRLELLADAVPWLLREPLRAARASAGTARRLISGARRRSRGVRAPDPCVRRSWLNAPVSPYRGVAWVRLPLADLRAASHAHGATVNDALLAVVAGALRQYAKPRNLLPEAPLVAGVPLAVRGEDDDRANAVTAVTVDLFTHEPDPVLRLHAIRDAMARQKGRRGSTGGEDLAAWADVPPPLLFSVMARAYVELDLEARLEPICNLIVSSVPGPSEALYLAGARLEAIYPLGPIFSGLALNVTAVSCGEGLDVGLVCCRRVVPELWSLASALSESLAELRARCSRPSASPGRSGNEDAGLGG